MGQEIFYCSGCQTQLRSVDFEKGRAYKLLGLEAICAKCAPDALKALPPDKLQALQKAMGGPPSNTPKTGTGRVPLATSTPKSGTGRIPVPAGPQSTRRIPTVAGGGSDGGDKKPLIFGLVLVVVLIIGALVALSGRHSPPVDQGSRTSPAPAPPDIPAPTPVSETARDRSAREALRKATLFADSRPTEFVEQLRLFDEALAEARGTGYENDVKTASAKAKRRAEDAAAAELQGLDRKVTEACGKEEFKKAGELLEDARRKPVTADWSAEIDRRSQELQARIDAAFGKLRTQALLAKPGSAEVKALKDRIAKWGLDRLLADFDKAIADAAAPKPPDPAPTPAPTPAPVPVPPDVPKIPPAVEAEAFLKSWNAALLLACGRDFSLAIQELEKTSLTLQDPTLKAQVTADLEILRAVAALHAEAGQAIAKWTPGRKISIGYFDFDNIPQRTEGPFLRVRPGTLEFSKGRGLPLGHITARSLCDFVAGRTRPTAALTCLIEGDLVGAKELAGESNPAIPARYWKWAADLSKPADNKETPDREREARYGYYFAVLHQGSPSLRADAALRCRKILDENPITIWARRNRAMLGAVADTTRDYVAGPATLRGAGMFRLEVPKTTPYWMSSIDIDPAKRRDNYVEMDFSALTDAPYRAWAYVGACCSEALVFYAQTSDLPGAEPGAEPGDPLKHPITSATKNHAGHAGRKGPSRWGWVEIPLPKYEKPGAKVLRLLTGSQGFAVSWMVVSTTRDKPPTETEVKEWERDLVHNAGPAGPTIGLAAWFKADAGAVIEGGKVAQWQDQSGHGRHALQIAPAARPLLAANAINGKPALRFDGVSNVLSFDCPVAGTTGLTIFLVAAASKNQRSNELGNYAALQWTESGPWGAVFLGPQQSCVAWRCGTSQFGNMGVWERPGGSPTGMSVTTLRKDATKEDVFVQGAQVSTADNKGPSIAHTGDTATIGGGTEDRRNPLRYFPGDVAEIIVFTRPLSEPERDAIERYLRSKYGL